MSSTISACIIAKNEEKHIGNCLESLKGVVDEIIVVDTGSTDKTVEIAKSYGAKVFFKEWENDFAKARNEALSHATMEYIIYVDCDECLAGEEWKNLKSKLDKRYEGFCLLLVNVIEGRKTLAAQTFRIFKNKPNYRFKGPIHEQVIRSILIDYTEKDIGFVSLEIHHFGYDDKEYDIEEKKKRNFKIYEHYPEEDKDGFFYYNLGGEYSRAGMKKEALEAYIKSYETDAFDNGFRQYLAIYLTKGYFEFQRFKDAIEQATEFLEKYEGFADLHFLRGTCFYNIGKFNEALKDMELYEKHRGNVNYPDFKLGESNDIQKILAELQSKGVSFQKELLGVVVDYRGTREWNSITRLNEYTHYVNVLVDGDTEEEGIKILEQMYCNVFKEESKLLEAIEDTKYTFYFKEKEFMERAWFIKAIEEVNKTHYDIMQSMALDHNSKVYISPRVVKTEVLLREGLDLITWKEFGEYEVAKDKIMIINI